MKLLVLIKEEKENRWVDFDAKKAFPVGHVIVTDDDKSYEVISVNGCKITAEEIVNE